jgi:hypothetical protein
VVVDLIALTASALPSDAGRSRVPECGGVDTVEEEMIMMATSPSLSVSVSLALAPAEGNEMSIECVWKRTGSEARPLPHVARNHDQRACKAPQAVINQLSCQSTSPAIANPRYWVGGEEDVRLSVLPAVQPPSETH